MYSTSEYCQRKDIHIHLVLVHHIAANVDWFGHLSVSKTLTLLKIYLMSNSNFSLYSSSIMIITMRSVRTKLLCSRNRLIPSEIARRITQKLDIGDWWLIYMLSRNLDPIVFKDVLSQLLERLEMRNSHQGDEKS